MRVEARRTELVMLDVEDFAEFRLRYPQWHAESVDDREVIAVCELCEQPILFGDDEAGIPDDDYLTTEDVYLHRACAAAMEEGK